MFMFNWQNTGCQKQLFEDGAAKTEERDAEDIGMCPMECRETGTPQHFLQCCTLHETKIIARDFNGVSKWMNQKNTHPEMRIIIEKSLLHWM